MKVNESFEQNSNIPVLTDLQKEIIRLIKKGSSSREISLITGFGLDQIHSERKMLMKNMNCSTMYDVIVKTDKFHLS